MLAQYTYLGNNGKLSKITYANGFAEEYVYDTLENLSEIWYTKSVLTVYIYDASGNPIGFQYHDSSDDADTWEVYWYEKNLHGDIVAVYNSAGTKLVSYAYDAWGNFITTYHNGGASTRAAKNPFTYRSYYYDRDLSLYYLNSRYYDPVVGRFINADSYVSTGQGFVGYNMFAYCNNNPVSYVDKSGHSSDGVFLQFLVSAVSYVGMSVASIFDEDIRNDMNAIGWNPLNTSEETVLDSKKVSFYKGVPVIRTDYEGTFSFGAIILSRGYTDDLGVFHIEDDPNTVKHEYGHNIQFMAVGLKNYFYGIAVPSVMSNVVNVGVYNLSHKTKVLISTSMYYSFPFERSADFFGNITSREFTYGAYSLEISLIYLGLLMIT